MKKLIFLLLLLCSPLYAKELTVDIAEVGLGAGTVAARAKQVTFIFSTTALLTISGNTFNTNDVSVTLTAEPGDTLGAISYNVAIGSMRIVRTQ